MMLGELLFVLAALTIAGALLGTVIFGIWRLVVSKVLGRDTSPQPEPGSADWVRAAAEASTVDLANESLLTERRGRTTKDPVVTLSGVRYRVTRLGSARFLVTHVDEGKRLGTFELDGEGRHQAVIPEADDPGQVKLIVQIAVLSSLIRLNAA